MTKIFESYLNYLRVERGLAESTIESYQRDVLEFLSFMRRRSWQLEQIDPKGLRQYVKMLGKSQLSARSVRGKISSLRSFFRFLVLDGYIEVDPTEGLESPKVWRKVPDVLSEAEVQLLLEQPDLSTPFGLRDRAMLETLYATGLRASELLRVRLDEVNFEEDYLRAFGKGSKERLVPIGKSALRFIKRYMKEVRPSLVRSNDEPLLFLTKKAMTVATITAMKRKKRMIRWGIISTNLTSQSQRERGSSRLPVIVTG